MTQSVSRRAKPIGYYVSNSSIDKLVDRYGAHLERISISPQQKSLMIAAIADHMAAAGDSYYPMQSSVECIDPDNLLGDKLKMLLVQIASDSTVDELNSLILAIADQHGDDIRNGAYN